jgi:hypothetical protein
MVATNLAEYIFAGSAAGLDVAGFVEERRVGIGVSFQPRYHAVDGGRHHTPLAR